MSDELLKAQVKGYSRKDGVYVRPHSRAGEAEHLPSHLHPQLGEQGDPVMIHHPHHPSSHSTWHNPNAVATFVPHGDVPLSINGVAIKPWESAPKTVEGWDYLRGINHDLEEPPFVLKPGKKASAGVVIEEPDGRVWLVAPTNAFGGYVATFPKGTADDELSLQGTALKEAFEETGLQIEITGLIGDFERTTSVARIYKAKRVGGDPTHAGWETQAVHLCPRGNLYEHLNMTSDHGIAEAVGAGPAPKPKKSE